MFIDLIIIAKTKTSQFIKRTLQSNTTVVNDKEGAAYPSHTSFSLVLYYLKLSFFVPVKYMYYLQYVCRYVSDNAGMRLNSLF